MITFINILASSGPYGPLFARYGYLGKDAFFLIGISLTKAFHVAQIYPYLHKMVSSSMRFYVWTYLCYRECFCRTYCWQELHFEFSRQNLSKN